jgi:hypothetical protein
VCEFCVITEGIMLNRHFYQLHPAVRKDRCSESVLLDNTVSLRLPLYSGNDAYDAEGLLNSAVLATVLLMCLGLNLVR